MQNYNKNDLLKNYKELYEKYEKKRMEYDNLFFQIADFFNENKRIWEELLIKKTDLLKRISELENIIEPIRKKVAEIRWNIEFKIIKKEGYMLFHPDRHGGSNKNAHEIFTRFNEAVKQKNLEEMKRIINEFKQLPHPEMINEDYDDASILASLSYLEKEIEEVDVRIQELKESANYKEVEEMRTSGKPPEPITKIWSDIKELEDKISSLTKEQRNMEEEIEKNKSSSDTQFE